MSLDSAISAIVYDANPAAATPYPVSFRYLDPAHVHVSIMAQGAGTVTVADGAAAFSSAQPALGAGKRVRIANTVYIIAARSSDTLFNFTTRPTIAATVFHLPDDAVELNTTEYTISPDGVRTVATLPSTSKVTIYRRTPLTQPAVLPAGGPLPAATLEGMADRLTMIAQELQTGIDGIALKLPASAASFNGIAVFANTAARNAATPEFVGQTGVQLDSATLYFGTNTVQNAWTAVTAAGGVRMFESLTALNGSTPDYVGQLAAIANTAASTERNLLFISRGTTPGAWLMPASPQYNAYTQWERVAWRHDEPLVSGERRWVGSIPRLLEPHALFISCNTPGEGTATVKVLRPEFPNVNKSLTTDPIELTALNCGSAVITALRDAATDNITERSRIEIEIVSAGTPVSVTTVSGQTTSTPDPGSVQQVVTGAVITSPDHGDKLVVFHRGAGTAHTDVPAATTGTDTYRVTGRQFVRGIKDLALTTGDVTVPVDATTAQIIRPGDRVTGATVPAGTVVTSVNTGAGEITLSAALTGDTSLIAISNPSRPPVNHVVDISVASGTTTIPVPVTGKVKIGDAALGTNIPTGTYVTSVGSGFVEISNAVTGGGITEITLAPPTRAATATAGTTSATVDTADGLRIGAKLSGPGVPSTGAYVTNISGATVTVDNAFTQNITSEPIQFTREQIRVTANIDAGSAVISMPYAASTTEVEPGMLVNHPAFPPGTVVESVSGSDVTLSKVALSYYTAAAVPLQPPGVWTGLELTILGKYTYLYP